MQLLLFGYAINTDVRHIPTVVYDQDHSAAVARLVAQPGSDAASTTSWARCRDYDEIERALRSGTAQGGAGGSAPLRRRMSPRSRPRDVQLVVDGSDPQTVASAINTAASLVAARSSELSVGRLALAAGRRAHRAPIELEPTTWYNPDLRTAVYVVPGLIGVILTMTMVMLTAMAIARERERGTLEQLIVSPVKNVELVVGKILPYVIIGYVQITLILLAGRVVFGVPFVGSLPLLYALSFVFIAANLALGLFFSTVAKTQQQAMQMSFFFLLPNILLERLHVPVRGDAARRRSGSSQALPLTHFLRIVRGITLKGSGFADAAAEFVWLSGILGALVPLASLRFSKKLG